MDSADTSKKLPGFRKDLTIYNGPLEVDGSPTFNIYDPVKGAYYKIFWKESLIFRSYQNGLTAEELAEKISSEFPVLITAEAVSQFFFQAYILGLLRAPKEGHILYHAHVKSQGSWFSWAIQNYLFLKIPLFQPNAFLTETLPYIKFLGSRIALFVYAMIICMGFTLLLNRSEKFFHTFSYFFNLEGIIIYGCVLACVKCIHELSHAYTAKNFGLYVPTMGVAILLLLPVLYTDVTDGWKLKKRRERFLISFAGIAAESVMAGLATIAWIMTTPGLFQSLCFVIASTSWFSTIVININPAVRFDGYYILSDLWGIDNLMARAFDFTRWKIHQWLFGIDRECPEEDISALRGAGFIFYTLYTIIYRFFLYTAIALFVYYEFTKTLGIFLFLTEAWIFFIMPVVWEIKTLYHLRSMMPFNFRTLITTACFLSIACWFFFPFPHEMTLPGVIVPEEKQIIYAPEKGKISNITAENGQLVFQGSPIIQIESESLQLEISQLEHDQQILKNELLFTVIQPETENAISQKKAALARNRQLLLALNKRKAKLAILSDGNGKVMNWNTHLSPGQNVYEGQIFGSIADKGRIFAIAFAKETVINDLKIGEKVRIIFQNSSLNFINGVIESIDPKRVNELLYPSLASIYGGPLAVYLYKTNPSEGKLFLHDSYYQVTLSVDEPQADLFFGQSVEIKIQGPWKSYFFEMMKTVYLAIFKESSF
jgi:putative peptide zinc metalloprotease protein